MNYEMKYISIYIYLCMNNGIFKNKGVVIKQVQRTHKSANSRGFCRSARQGKGQHLCLTI